MYNDDHVIFILFKYCIHLIDLAIHFTPVFPLIIIRGFLDALVILVGYVERTRSAEAFRVIRTTKFVTLGTILLGHNRSDSRYYTRW